MVPYWSANKITECSVKHNNSLISVCVWVCVHSCALMSAATRAPVIQTDFCVISTVWHNRWHIRIPEIACPSDLCCLRKVRLCVYTSCDPSGHTGLRVLYRIQKEVLSIIGLSPNILPILGSLCYLYSPLFEQLLFPACFDAKTCKQLVYINVNIGTSVFFAMVVLVNRAWKWAQVPLNWKVSSMSVRVPVSLENLPKT